MSGDEFFEYGEKVPETEDAVEEARQEQARTKGHQEKVRRDASDTEPDSEAEPAGAGVRGVGPPMQVGAHDRRRTLCDGAGLCSLGCWPPWRRPTMSNDRLRQVRDTILKYIDDLQYYIGDSAEGVFNRLCAGTIQADPFEGPDTGFRELVDKVLELLSTEDGGAYNRAEDVAQPVRIRALQCILRLGGDPDARGMEHFARGVKIGVGTRMPRTPAIYARKRRWRLPTQADCGFDWESERATVGEAWRDNYQSASLHREAIMEQLLDSVDRGLALRMKPDEAEHHFPGLSINSLGGVAKLSDAGEVVGVRIVMDGTHGVVVNSAIRQRDQDRCPIASDVKRQQREQASTRPARGVALDVQEAHHLPRVHRSDWRHQCCRCDGCEDVFIFTVGCFGISSAAYWWSRLGGAPADAIWLLLMADDLKAESTSTSPSRSTIYVVLILLILGVPLAWRKSQGARSSGGSGMRLDFATSRSA